ncbi:uncharacterized protein [Clytia hemisphaerica]
MSARNQHYKNSEVKGRVNERIESVLLDSGKLAQAITKSSRSREILYQCTKSFAGTDNTMNNIDQNLKLIEGNLMKLETNTDRLNTTMEKVSSVTSQVQNINKR